jgi:hypothetical protein
MEDQDPFTCLAMMGGGFFKEAVFRDASISVAGEIIRQIEEETPVSSTSTPNSIPFTKNKMAQVARKPLLKILERTIDLSARRIQFGETNVKGHLFCSAVLAQIQAMENGEPVEEAIMNASLKSAESCISMLTDVLSSTTAPFSEQYPPVDQTYMLDGGADPMFGLDFMVSIYSSYIFVLLINCDFLFDVLIPDFWTQNTGFDLNNPDVWLFSKWEMNDAWL